MEPDSSSQIVILYIDDEPNMGEIARLFFEERFGGFEVHLAINGFDALEMIKTGQYDAIVADYEMPDINGIDILRKLREEGDDIPFLVCTGKSRHAVVIEALNAGADFYLQKGEDPLVLFTEMRQMLNQAVGRRRSEKALAKSRLLLEEIIDFLPDATMAVNASNKVIAWNRIMEDLTGIAADRIIGQILDIDHLECRDPTATDLLERIYQKGVLTIFNSDSPEDYIKGTSEEFHHESGDEYDKGRFFRISVSPIIDAKKGQVGFIGSVRDITFQKRSEYALLESRENFRALVENNADIIMRFDRQGRHVYVNPAIAPYLPFDPEDLIGKTYTDLRYPPKKHTELDALIEEVIRTANPVEENITIESARGLVSFNMRLLPELDFEGKIKSVLSILRDITYQKQFEEEKNALLSQIERNLGEFAILNDGIRNPLAVIAGWLSMMDTLQDKERETLMFQVRQIDEMITQLDRRWVESEKVLGFLRRHYDIQTRTYPD